MSEEPMTEMTEDENRLMMVTGMRAMSRIYLKHPLLCSCCRVKLDALIVSCNEYLETRNQEDYHPLLKRFNESFDKLHNKATDPTSPSITSLNPDSLK